MIYKTPDNLVELLSSTVRAASKTAFYSAVLDGRAGVSSVEEFRKIPITSLVEYRKQRLADVVADPSQIEWIVGQHKGQSATSVAVAEGPDEAANRYAVFTDAVKECVSLQGQLTCAVVTSAHRRFFAAEIGTILIRSGISTHVFVDCGSHRTYEYLRIVEPDMLVNLVEGLEEEELPETIKLCITFRRSQRMNRFRQLDVYIVDELGFLGHSTDCGTYALNQDLYYFEQSEDGFLVITALMNRTQPMVRLRTMDKVEYLRGHALEFAQLSPVM